MLQITVPCDEGQHRITYNVGGSSRTGRSPRSFWNEYRCQNRSFENGRGGKSELRRAVCRITSGTADSSPLDGKCHRKHTAGRQRRVRVKRCGKSAPPRQRWRGQGKPHTEQDQIGRKSRRCDRFGISQSNLRHRRDTRWLGTSQPSGRSLEPLSNGRPRGMIVPPQGGQNSAYRSGCCICE